MDRTGLIRVNNLKQALRGWMVRGTHWLGLAAFSISGAALAGDYDGSPQVAEFIAEMTRDHGFAGEQLVSLFSQAERKQAIREAKRWERRGYDTKVMRRVIAERKRDQDDIAEEEAILDLYRAALRMGTYGGGDDEEADDSGMV